MIHMLDSDTASYIIKGKSPNIEAKLCTLMPAAVCILAVLVTNNKRHYQRIEAPLILENWVSIEKGT